MSALASKRFPRERFTRRLEVLCQHLDRNFLMEHSGTWALGVLNTLRVTGTVRTRVNEVVVFGSYARGARECADLDLFVDMDVQWVGQPTLEDGTPWTGQRTPNFKALRWLALGRFTHADVFSYQEHLVMVFPEGRILDGVMIWRPGLDWHQALQSIVVREGAGHHARLVDALPIGLQQTAWTLLGAEPVAQAVVDGVLQVDFHPFEERIGLDSSELSDSERKILAIAGRSLGRQRMEVLPMVALYARTMGADLAEVASESSGGLHRFKLGRSYFAVPDFENWDVSTISLVPFWSSRGPNGVATFRRGPRHPLRMQFQGHYAYVLGSGEATIAGDHSEYRAISLFSSPELAEGDRLNDGDQDLSVTKIEGDALLEAVLGKTFVVVDGEEFLMQPTVIDGAVERPVDPDVLVRALPRAA